MVTWSEIGWQSLVCINCWELTVNSRVDEGVTVGSGSFKRLLSADDFLLPASSQQGIQYPLDRLSSACNQACKKINAKKARYSVFPETEVSACALWVTGNMLQQVDKFKFLRVVFTSDGWWNKKINAWIGKYIQFCVSFIALW